MRKPLYEVHNASGGCMPTARLDDLDLGSRV